MKKFKRHYLSLFEEEKYDTCNKPITSGTTSEDHTDDVNVNVGEGLSDSDGSNSETTSEDHMNDNINVGEVLSDSDGSDSETYIVNEEIDNNDSDQSDVDEHNIIDVEEIEEISKLRVWAIE
ncbi:uncharacterized protein LOC112458064, partial [Temnothorax curvispinosus]